MKRKESGVHHRTVRWLLVCAVVGGAVALGLAAAGGTLAALTASQTVSGATITAGTLDLTVNGAQTATLDAYSVTPGTPESFPFTIANTGTTAVELSTTISVTSVEAISDYTTARVTPVSNAGSCVPGLTGTPGSLHGFAAPDFASLAAGESLVVCLEIALDDETPVSLSGQSATFVSTVTAIQKAR